MTDHPGYYLYALANPAFPSAVRLSLTADLERTLARFNENCPKGDYYYLKTAYAENARAQLLQIHHALRPLRISGYWFEIAPAIAAQVLQLPS
jgi:hypothetical protein